jgi:hypothetical protein
MDINYVCISLWKKEVRKRRGERERGGESFLEKKEERKVQEEDMNKYINIKIFHEIILSTYDIEGLRIKSTLSIDTKIDLTIQRDPFRWIDLN